MKRFAFKIIIYLPLNLFFLQGSVLACEVCRRNQPEILQDISHGVGPLQFWDNMIVGGATILVVIVLFYSAKLLWKPGEQHSSHIKNLVKDF